MLRRRRGAEFTFCSSFFPLVRQLNMPAASARLESSTFSELLLALLAITPPFNDPEGLKRVTLAVDPGMV